MEMLASGALTLPEERTPAPDAKKAASSARPAGLTVANDLAEAGVAVTVYGPCPLRRMLRYGIPNIAFPRKFSITKLKISGAKA